MKFKGYIIYSAEFKRPCSWNTEGAKGFSVYDTLEDAYKMIKKLPCGYPKDKFIVIPCHLIFSVKEYNKKFDKIVKLKSQIRKLEKQLEILEEWK